MGSAIRDNSVRQNVPILKKPVSARKWQKRLALPIAEPMLLLVRWRKHAHCWIQLSAAKDKLQLNSVLNKTILLPSQRQRGPLNLSLVNLKISLLKQMKMPCVVAVPQWLSSKQESVSSKLNLEMFKLTLGKMQRDIRSPSAAARNLHSRLMKTRRTKTAWQSWPLSSSKRSKLTKSRLRKLKKLLP